MKLVQLPECGGWDLQFADKLRKSIAKKNPKEYEELTEKFFQGIKEKGCDERFCHYVWDVQIALSRGYGFNASHTLAYSIIALQEMNLAYKYPIVYWNTANLIVDSGGVQTVDFEDDDEAMIEVELAPDEDIVEITIEDDDEELEEWEEANKNITVNKEDKKKKKPKNIDYGRIASIIGKLGGYGIQVSPPDINKSSYTFTPIAETNTILYGLRGIARISGEKITEIMEQRPYLSLKDFLGKNKLNIIQIVNLIKSGAFDELEKIPREEIMHKFLYSTIDKKVDLNLRNMQALITKDLIPEEMIFYKKLFLFNKFLKDNKDGIYYKLNDAAINYITNNFDIDLIENGVQISQKIWDNIYKKAMNPMREYIKAHKQEMLQKLNDTMYNEVAEKYSSGSISQWEMDSISFYYHEHELATVASQYDDFFTLPEEPEIERSFSGTNGQEVKIYTLHKIIGTVIDKDKLHNTVTLLTPTGVVNVKIYKNQFALYDKQISQRDSEGVKHVVEYSWFKRGTLLMVQGIRRSQDYIPKKYKGSVYPVISKIINIDKSNNLIFQFERMEAEE